MTFTAWQKQLARRVKTLREARGLRQQDFEPEVSEHTVQAVEYGTTDPKASTLWALAKRLGVTLEKLVGEEA